MLALLSLPLFYLRVSTLWREVNNSEVRWEMTGGYSSYATNSSRQIFAPGVDEEMLCDSYKRLAIASPRQEEAVYL